MSGIRSLVWVALGGALGSCLRYTIGVALTRSLGDRFPWATLVINLSGAFLIGLLSVIGSSWVPDPRFRLFVLVGVLGGYTTFSTYTLEAVHLWNRSHPGRAMVYLAGAAAVGFAATMLGLLIGSAIVRPENGRSPGGADSHKASETR